MTQSGDLSETITLTNAPTVLTDVESDEFRNVRGTKQGDRLLFNSVLQSPVEKDTETWNENGLGIKLSDEKKKDCISNLRFADNVLMMATDCKKSTEAQGLEIHPNKTKVLINQKANALREVEIDGIHVEILPPEAEATYLGQMRCNTGSDALRPHSPDTDKN